MEQIPAAVVHRVLVPFLRPCRAFQKVCTGRDTQLDRTLGECDFRDTGAVLVSDREPTNLGVDTLSKQVSMAAREHSQVADGMSGGGGSVGRGGVAVHDDLEGGGGVLPRHRVPDLPLPTDSTGRGSVLVHARGGGQYTDTDPFPGGRGLV